MRIASADAPAKINLTLEILGKRPDGYHELCMVMQSVSLCDRVTITLGSPGNPGSIELVTDPPMELAQEKNLAYRAAELFFRIADVPRRSVKIRVDKRIPAAAGLGGGSADAAAVLRLLNRLTGANLPAETLAAASLPLGADVPFCVTGGTCLARGVGERLRSLPPLPDCALVLCTPDFPCPTGEIFRAYDSEPVNTHPDAPRLERALLRGDLREAAECCANDLEHAVAAVHPEIGEIESIMLRGGALAARMSGSGSTVWGLFENDAPAREVCGVLASRFAQTHLTHPVPPWDRLDHGREWLINILE